MGLVVKLPGIRRQEVQTLGRRDSELPMEGFRRVRAETEKNRDEGLKTLEYKRQARKEDLRGAGADFDTMRQEVASARSYFQAGMIKARATGEMFAGFQQIAEAGAKFSIDNQIRKAERNGQEADIKYQEGMKAFSDKYEGDEIRNAALEQITETEPDQS